MKRWLFLAHRWLGLGGCLVVWLWFASGFVMMYVPYPSLHDEERLRALPSLDLAQVRVPPAAALASAQGEVLGLRLVQAGDAPVYAMLMEGRGWHGLRADDGSPVDIGPAQASRTAERFGGAAALQATRLDRDQWSLSGRLDPHRPLYAVDLADGGRHYVSSRTGELVLDTTRAERGWNWVGAVLHWVYPTVLRSRPGLWHWVVVGLSGYALLTALLGTVVGVLRWRRYANGRHTPYRGWMRWHHLLGLAATAFVLGWLLSGLLSMNPAGLFPSRAVPAAAAAAWRGGASLQPALPQTAAGARELQWLADADGTFAWLRQDSRQATLWRGEHQLQVDEAFVRARAKALGLGPPVAIERLASLDLHYHARTAQHPLPVWRLRFADGSWWHVDGQSGQPFARLSTGNRAARWLYHGLHSWDFEPLLSRRPLWDILMLAAMTVGFALATTSVVLAWRRLRGSWRSTAWRAASPAGTPA